MGFFKVVFRPVSATILGASLIVAAGVGGHFGVKAVKAAKTFNRVVTVRGLSEKETNADLAIWPIGFRVAADDLPTLEKSIAKCRETIEKFLLANGFDKAEISNIPPTIHDFKANGDYDASKKTFRYSAETAVALRSSKALNVVKAMEQADELIKAGVPLCQGDYQERPKFLFTGLTALKPSMIEEANKDARTAAEKFAKDSKCNVGRIMRATQGSFEIEERDPQTPYRKTIRVVTTVDFLLE